MQFLWDLVHQLQVLNLLLMINVEYPSVIDSFIGYFEVASGSLEEVTQYLPEIPQVVIDEAQLIDDFYLFNHKLRGEFPFILIEYKDALLINVVFVLVILPIFKLITLCRPK